MSAEYTPETSTGVAGDNEYASRTGQTQIPVQKDEASIEDPIDADTADSDKVLGMKTILPLDLGLTLTFIFRARREGCHERGQHH